MAPTIGFVVATILDYNGNCMVEYTYDAWGKLLNTVDNSGINLGTINPLRYRGYYYDQETGLYYLQSRYYDPTVGRFINADDVSFLGINGTVISHNLFAYCENNPINDSDSTGYISVSSIIRFIKKIGWKVWKIIKSVYNAFKKPGKIALKPFEVVIDMAVGFFVPSLKTSLKLLTYKSVNKQLVQAAFRKSGSGFINLMAKFGVNIGLNSLFSASVNSVINKHATRLLSVGGIICLVLDIVDGKVDYWLNYGKIIG